MIKTFEEVETKLYNLENSVNSAKCMSESQYYAMRDINDKLEKQLKDTQHRIDIMQEKLNCLYDVTMGIYYKPC